MGLTFVYSLVRRRRARYKAELKESITAGKVGAPGWRLPVNALRSRLHALSSLPVVNPAVSLKAAVGSLCYKTFSLPNSCCKTFTLSRSPHFVVVAAAAAAAVTAINPPGETPTTAAIKQGGDRE